MTNTDKLVVVLMFATLLVLVVSLSWKVAVQRAQIESLDRLYCEIHNAQLLHERDSHDVH